MVEAVEVLELVRRALNRLFTVGRWRGFGACYSEEEYASDVANQTTRVAR